jgi:hypothetical protein
MITPSNSNEFKEIAQQFEKVNDLHAALEAYTMTYSMFDQLSMSASDAPKKKQYKTTMEEISAKIKELKGKVEMQLQHQPTMGTGTRIMNPSQGTMLGTQQSHHLPQGAMSGTQQLQGAQQSQQKVFMGMDVGNSDLHIPMAGDAQEEWGRAGPFTLKLTEPSNKMFSSSKEKERTNIFIHKKEKKDNVYITYMFDGPKPVEQSFGTLIDFSIYGEFRREKKMKVDLPFTNKSSNPSEFFEVTGYVKDYCIGFPGEDSKNTTACQDKDTEDEVEFERKETWTFKQSDRVPESFDQFKSAAASAEKFGKAEVV